jgi:DNA-binding response OmpR family regulator
MRDSCILPLSLWTMSSYTVGYMKKIAIIEDDEATRATLDAMLTDEGYETILIARYRDPLAELRAAEPDLVLLDLMLGDWSDGLTIARAVRADPLLTQLPIIVLSAAQNMLRRYRPEFVGLHCQVLDKPFDLQDLLVLIAGALTQDQK